VDGVAEGGEAGGVYVVRDDFSSFSTGVVVVVVGGGGGGGGGDFCVINFFFLACVWSAEVGGCGNFQDAFKLESSSS